ncbi:hypothetical protein G8E10_04830 [Rhizobiaceae bacterium CRRU44]|uniref:Uncharacterized protein n=1 Tax=Ferranicluibacter rubi TaxID=2715133 RepID=A0AA44CB60_9HYPH|nr:hypothetical protein [Ferranicluibacter rubi]NHT75081.1 hypothetical protein [Ferranicluibacter rubi]
MDTAELYRAVREGFTDALEDRKPAPQMVAISPFDAFDEDDEPVRVIGIVDDPEFLKFIVIVEEEGGEIFPLACRSVYRRKSGESG